MDSSLTIRVAGAGDRDGVRHVIESVFAEYGFTFEPDGYNQDTEDVDKYYWQSGGGFWVLEIRNQIVGTVGLKRISSVRCDLARLYLLKSYRGMGYGKKLYEHAKSEAKKMGFTEMEIWSDVKLVSAHGMYSKSGALLLGQRICDDPDQSLEQGFLAIL
jgi:putative acetyltransferase